MGIRKNDLSCIVKEASIKFFGEDICSEELVEKLFRNYGIYVASDTPKVVYIGFLRIDSLEANKNYTSKKIENIVVDVKRSLAVFFEMVGFIHELGTDNSVFCIYTLGKMIQYLYKMCTITITDEQAIILVALWNSCDQCNQISLEDGFKCVGSLYRRIKNIECTWEKYIEGIERLEKIKSLVFDIEKIELLEEIRISPKNK